MIKQPTFDHQKHLSEHDLIAAYFAPLAGVGSFGLRDDAALFTPSHGSELVITTDALIAGVHFFAQDEPASIARKAMGVNLSDLAAKGAKPCAFVLTLALTKDQNHDWLQAFSQGLAHMIEVSGCALIGGDTVRTSGPLMISITMFGEVPTGKMLKRSGANQDDYIIVTGTIGDAALGLKLREKNIQNQTHQASHDLSKNDHDFLIDRYLHPQPRLAIREALLTYATSAMDISDGLIGDTEKLLHASRIVQNMNYGAHIVLPNVPLSHAAHTILNHDPSMLEVVVTGGDDYEILCTVPPRDYESFAKHARLALVNVTIIGKITLTGRVIAIDDRGDEKTFSSSAYSHF